MTRLISDTSSNVMSLGQVNVVIGQTLAYHYHTTAAVCEADVLSSSCSYDDPEILAGQGTAALEVLEQMDRLGEKIDAVVIPVGGGGLLAGMATTLKHLAPEVTVIVSCVHCHRVMQCVRGIPSVWFRDQRPLVVLAFVRCTFVECGITQYSPSVLLIATFCYS